MKLVERAWLAGLLEGEGHFGLDKTSPHIGLTMTDKDVVEHAARLMGAPSVRVREDRPGWKPQYRARVYGRRALDVMAEIEHLLGERRGARVRYLTERCGARYADRVCPNCKRSFFPTRSDKRSCSRRCATRRSARLSARRRRAREEQAA